MGFRTDLLHVEDELDRLEQQRAMYRQAPRRPVGDRNDRARVVRVLDHHIARLRRLRDRVLCEGGVRGSPEDADCRSGGPGVPPSQSTRPSTPDDNGERTDKTAAHWALTDLLSDLGQALAFVSIEGWELLELRASLQKGERAT